MNKSKKLTFLKKYLIIILTTSIPLLLVLLFTPIVLTFMHSPGKISQAKQELLREITSDTHQYIAHRGFFDTANSSTAENTLPSFKRAVDRKLSFELDVHLTKDNQLAVIHDDKLGLNAIHPDRQKRIDDQEDLKLIHTPIKELTLEQINTLTSKYQLYNTANKVPTLNEVFSQTKDILDIERNKSRKTFILVEIKANGHDSREYIANLCSAVDNLLKEYKNTRIMYAIQSFHPHVLNWFYKNSPEVLRGFLSKNYNAHHNPGDPKGITGCLLGNLYSNFLSRPDFIAYEYYEGVKETEGLKNYRKLYNPVVFAWTIRDKNLFQELKGKFDAFIFDSLKEPIID